MINQSAEQRKNACSMETLGKDLQKRTSAAAHGKREDREKRGATSASEKETICNKSAKLVLIVAAALWTLRQGRRQQLAADVHVAHNTKESVESLQLEALAAGKSRGGGTTKQTLLVLALTERSGKRYKRYKKRTHLALTAARRSCCWRHEAGGRTKLLHNPHCNSTTR
jgi:hypothetical protein